MHSSSQPPLAASDPAADPAPDVSSSSSVSMEAMTAMAANPADFFSLMPKDLSAMSIDPSLASLWSSVAADATMATSWLQPSFAADDASMASSISSMSSLASLASHNNTLVFSESAAMSMSAASSPRSHFASVSPPQPAPLLGDHSHLCHMDPLPDPVSDESLFDCVDLSDSSPPPQVPLPPPSSSYASALPMSLSMAMAMHGSFDALHLLSRPPIPASLDSGSTAAAAAAAAASIPASEGAPTGASPSEAAEARVSPEGASISATASVAAAAAAAATSATSSMLASGLSSPTQGPLHHELHHEPHHWLLSLPASPSSSASLAASAAPFMLDISALPLQGSHHHHNHHNHDDDDNDDDNDDDDGRSYNHRSHAFQDRTSPCFSHQHSQPCSSSSSSSLPSSSSPLQGPLSPHDMGVLTSTPSLSNGRIDFKLLPNPILFPQHSSSHLHESLHLPVSPLLPVPAEPLPLMSRSRSLAAASAMHSHTRGARDTSGGALSDRRDFTMDAHMDMHMDVDLRMDAAVDMAVDVDAVAFVNLASCSPSRMPPPSTASSAYTLFDDDKSLLDLHNMDSTTCSRTYSSRDASLSVKHESPEPEDASAISLDLVGSRRNSHSESITDCETASVGGSVSAKTDASEATCTSTTTTASASGASARKSRKRKSTAASASATASKAPKTTTASQSSAPAVAKTRSQPARKSPASASAATTTAKDDCDINIGTASAKSAAGLGLAKKPSSRAKAQPKSKAAAKALARANSAVADASISDDVHTPPADCPEGYASPRRSLRPTVFEGFTQLNLDWCRYCGVTQRAQTAAFRPGPWGKRTLCNKHGCDYKGYGYIEKEPRLNLTAFAHEHVKERLRPILQDWCASCFQPHSLAGNILVQCDGCCRAYHEQCCKVPIPAGVVNGTSTQKWYCDSACSTTSTTGCVMIEVPKRNLPLMRSMARPPGSGKAAAAAAAAAALASAKVDSVAASSPVASLAGTASKSAGKTASKTVAASRSGSKSAAKSSSAKADCGPEPESMASPELGSIPIQKTASLPIKLKMRKPCTIDASETSPTDTREVSAAMSEWNHVLSPAPSDTAQPTAGCGLCPTSNLHGHGYGQSACCGTDAHSHHADMDLEGHLADDDDDDLFLETDDEDFGLCGSLSQSQIAASMDVCMDMDGPHSMCLATPPDSGSGHALENDQAAAEHSSEDDEEDLSDDAYLQRHAKYELREHTIRTGMVLCTA